MSDNPLIVNRINLDAIAYNVRYLLGLSKASQFMAVVKADAYNHGAAMIAATAVRAGATHLGVTTLVEALKLRNAGIEAPILAWIFGANQDFLPALEHNIICGISTVSQLQNIIAQAKKHAIPARVELKIDTGLRRNGLSLDDFSVCIPLLQAAGKHVILEGVFTHMVSADQHNHPFVDVQRDVIVACAEQLRKAGFNPVAHCANTAGLLNRPDIHLDRVRPGIGIYGYNPTDVPHDLLPAMTVETKIIAVRKISAGEGVSYNHIWHSPEDGYVVLLPVGYADGLPRALSGKIQVSINGVTYPQVGRICMDQCLVYVGKNTANITVGDTAILISDGSTEAMTVRNWAELLDTIDYEIVSLMRGRTVRVYESQL